MSKTIYAPLYKDVRRIREVLQTKDLSIIYPMDEPYRWFWAETQLKSRDEYQKVETKLKERIDRFFHDIAEFNSKQEDFSLTTLPNLISENDKVSFLSSIPPYIASYTYEDISHNRNTTPNDLRSLLTSCLLRDIHPRDYYTNKERRTKTIEYHLTLNNQRLHEPTMKEFEEFYQTCSKAMKANTTYLEITNIKSNLLNEAKEIESQLDTFMEKAGKSLRE